MLQGDSGMPAIQGMRGSVTWLQVSGAAWGIRHGLLRHDTVDAPLQISGDDIDHFRNKGFQLLNASPGGDHDDDWYWQPVKVLLEFDALIRGYERIESMVGSELQQVTVLAASPAHARDRAYLEWIGEKRPEQSRNGFVKQQLHPNSR